MWLLPLHVLQAEVLHSDVGVHLVHLVELSHLEQKDGVKVLGLERPPLLLARAYLLLLEPALGDLEGRGIVQGVAPLPPARVLDLVGLQELEPLGLPFREIPPPFLVEIRTLQLPDHLRLRPLVRSTLPDRGRPRRLWRRLEGRHVHDGLLAVLALRGGPNAARHRDGWFNLLRLHRRLFLSGRPQGLLLLKRVLVLVLVVRGFLPPLPTVVRVGPQVLLRHADILVVLVVLGDQRHLPPLRGSGLGLLLRRGLVLEEAVLQELMPLLAEGDPLYVPVVVVHADLLAGLVRRGHRSRVPLPLAGPPDANPLADAVRGLGLLELDLRHRLDLRLLLAAAGRIDGLGGLRDDERRR
mmetsp:Transcript_1000/g.2976  ORF Transcript_1000/g.2976 Transcript_1000/m.2976 type:complete len:354 (+) Transcript_1000:4224-5285(+)